MPAEVVLISESVLVESAGCRSLFSAMIVVPVDEVSTNVVCYNKHSGILTEKHSPGRGMDLSMLRCPLLNNNVV